MSPEHRKVARVREIGDHELVTVFLKFHLSKTQSPRLKIEAETRTALVPEDYPEQGLVKMVKKSVQTGNLLLMYREFSVSDWQIFCRMSKVKDRHILQVNPELGDKRLLSIVYASFQENNIFDFKLNPLSEERSLEINVRK